MPIPDESTPQLSALDAPGGEPAPEPERYTPLGLLGAGGMGEVHAVFDARLGRQVALKRPRAEVPGAAEALRREAAVTAALEHPGIVPIYDAGAGPVPWYTMRLVRGRSLRAVIGETPRLPERLALLRPLLAAIEAVAYAHDRGVLHCDLKAANVLLGEHGEVQVVDWGLAAAGGERSRGGTPATMAPEQARGEPATPRSDVWSLGMLLLELLGGEAPHRGRTDGGLRQAVGRGEHPPIPGPAEGVPTALAAIVLRCLQVEPEGRYPDAGALAADVARFLDGRLVEAHDYTPGEVLGRWLRQHRAAVGSAALALLVVAMVTAVAAFRTIEERDAARAARERSDENLARALVLAARQAARAGARPEAETLAAQALVLRPSPEARGVLAAFGSSPRPESAPLELPGCEGQRRWSEDGRWLCILADALEGGGPGLQPWRVEESVQDATFAGEAVILTLPGKEALVLDGQSGARLARMAGLLDVRGLHPGSQGAWQQAGRSLLWLDPAGEATVYRPCGEEVVAALDEGPDGSVMLVCGAGGLLRFSASSGATLPIPLGRWDPRASTRALAVGPQGTAALGTDRGEVILVPEDGPVRRVRLDRAISALHWEAGGERLVVSQWGRGPVVLHGRTGQRLGALPATGRAIGPFGSCALATLDLEGRSGRCWTLGGLEALALGESPGLTGVLAGPGGSVLIGRGDGKVLEMDIGSGEELGRAGASTRPLKAMVALPDQGGFATIGVEEGVQLHSWDLSRSRSLHPMTGPRLGRLGAGLLALPYGPGGRWIPFDGGEPLAFATPAPTFFDLGSDEAGQRAALLDEQGGAWRVLDEGDRQPLQLARVPDAMAIDIDSRGRMVIARPASLLVREPDGRERVLAHPALRVFDLAISPDDGRVATGGIDGAVRVLDLETGALLAVLEGHDERVASLAFDGPGRLLSASWDGHAQRWDLSVLERPPQAILEEVQAAWGLSVEQALAAGAP